MIALPSSSCAIYHSRVGPSITYSIMLLARNTDRYFNAVAFAISTLLYIPVVVGNSPISFLLLIYAISASLRFRSAHLNAIFVFHLFP